MICQSSDLESSARRPDASDPRAYYRQTFRVRKEDSAFVYNLLESYEGLASYSTLDHPVGAAYRDLELTIPAGQKAEAIRLLEAVAELVYPLNSLQLSTPEKA